MSSWLPTVSPMAPVLARAPFHRPGCVYEEKYDGGRMLAYKEGGSVRLVSRSGLDHTARFRELADAVAKLRALRLILDGEVFIFDAKLVTRFHLLGEQTESVASTPPVFASSTASPVRDFRYPDDLEVPSGCK